MTLHPPQSEPYVDRPVRRRNDPPEEILERKKDLPSREEKQRTGFVLSTLEKEIEISERRIFFSFHRWK